MKFATQISPLLNLFIRSSGFLFIRFFGFGLLGPARLKHRIDWFLSPLPHFNCANQNSSHLWECNQAQYCIVLSSYFATSSSNLWLTIIIDYTLQCCIIMHFELSWYAGNPFAEIILHHRCLCLHQSTYIQGRSNHGNIKQLSTNHTLIVPKEWPVALQKIYIPFMRYSQLDSLSDQVFIVLFQNILIISWLAISPNWFIEEYK